MPVFDITKGQFLTLQQVADKLKLRLPQLGNMIAQRAFPSSDKTVNGVQYWNQRTVQTWLGSQPTK
jgi:predicted DNA-binding transcriptional regulator AlpA